MLVKILCLSLLLRVAFLHALILLSHVFFRSEVRVNLESKELFEESLEESKGAQEDKFQKQLGRCLSILNLTLK